MNEDVKSNGEAAEDRVNREASEWIAKRDLGFSPGEQDAFFEWLAADPRHGEAYSGRNAVWDNLNKLAEWRPEHGSEPNPDLLAVPKHTISYFFRWVSAVSSVAAILVFGLLLWQFQGSDSSSDFGKTRLAAGESALSYEHHVLEDGSVVELNRGAQASVEYSKDRRQIHLFAGEAHFTVAKDPDRPFEVVARGAVVKALGTVFNVALLDDKVEVLVTEGRVQMKPSHPVNQERIEPAKDPLAWELAAGQLSVVALDFDTIFPVVEEVSQEEISRKLAWKNEMLDFSASPLSEVVLEFNRRNHTQILLADNALGQRKITAALRPRNINGFLELLELTMGVEAVSTGDDTILLRERSH